VPNDPELAELVALYYPTPGELAEFAAVAADELPEPYRELLSHEHHMTVTVERFHRARVDVRVLEAHLNGERYIRKILLQRHSDGAVVQFGIVRLDFAQVSPEVRRDIESQLIPLGRVLIHHNVLRRVYLCELFRVTCGPELARLFGCAVGTVTFGRTALIDMNGRPALELLEILAPTK